MNSSGFIRSGANDQVPGFPGSGRRAIHTALREFFGGVGPADYWFDGRTDPQIVREYLAVVAADTMAARLSSLFGLAMLRII